MSTVHVEPVDDLVEHEDEGCVCGPEVEAVFREDGSNGWLISHHSLDGRELKGDTMSAERLGSIQARMDAAVKEPWHLAGGNEWISPIGIGIAPDDGGVSVSEGEFIANAPSDVAFLLELVRNQQAVIDGGGAQMNETNQMTIVEFLEARIAEDEALATAASKSIHGAVPDEQWDWASYVLSAERDSTEQQDAYITTWWPARVLTECAAKRAILALHDALEDKGWQSGKAHVYLWCGSCGTLDDAPVPYPCETLEALASAYKDHPDYQQEWNA